MSSGVSDQMKIPGNTVKNEERNIPWSQQVDEASNENLASPTTDDNCETNKKYGKPTFYNNTNKRDDFQPPNAWGAQNARRTVTDNPSGGYNRNNRSDDAHISAKLDNRSNPSGASTSNDDRKSSAPSAAAPKKTTWASIASQPAKLTSRTTSITSSHKKKGPGMPPPPMIPGKHDLDINAWDLPNNNPPPVPSPPPPPIEQPFIVEPAADFSTSSSHASDHVLGARHDRGHKVVANSTVGSDYPKQNDDNKTANYNNSNFGRLRASPNGHSRKNWSTQHPLHPPSRPSIGGGPGGNASGPLRRGDNTSIGPGGGGGIGGGGGGGIAGGVPTRYVSAGSGGDRRGGGGGGGGHYGGSRVDQHDNTTSSHYDYRDENTPRNTQHTNAQNTDVNHSGETPQAVLEELRDKNNYNPPNIDMAKASGARFFVIKSYSEDDIHRSIKYEIWCSTDHGNKRLDDAFKERHEEGGNVLLFFSVNGSGHFCGMAQMMTAVDYNSTSSVWSQDKWKGKFKVKWIYVKDVPNPLLRHIRLENNENKSVTHSRDTQEVPNSKGIEVLEILHSFKHTTSIFDDFYHYEKKQEEEVSSKKPYDNSMNSSQVQSNDGRDGGRVGGLGSGGGGGGSQKYFSGNIGGGGGGGGSGLGSGGGGGGSLNFRDRNHSRGYHNNYNDHRRFDSHRTIGGSGGSNSITGNSSNSNSAYSSSQKDRDADTDRDRERERDRERGDRDNSEYSNRHVQKYDYQRRDDRLPTKHNSSSSNATSSSSHRDRDFSEEQNPKGGDSRYRTGPRDTQKDNEYPPSAERVRGGADY